MTEHHLTDPQLVASRERFERASRRALELSSSLSAEQLSWKPATDRWSVVECIEHLNASAEAYRPGLEAVLSRARDQGPRQPPYRRGTWVGRFILSTVRDHPERRVKAPAVFLPSQTDLEPGPVFERFESTQHRWLAALDAADGLDLGLRFATPVSRFLRVSLEQAFLIHSHHELRHLDQAERLRQLPEFPS